MSVATTKTRRRPRRGSSTAGVIGLLALAGGLVTVAVVVGPRWSSASGGGGSVALEPVAAEVPRHQQIIDLLASVIARSHRVIACHEPDRSPYLELVLWVEDSTNPTLVDPAEIALLSYSELMQTIVLTELAPPKPDALGRMPAPPAPLAMSDITAPSFCRAWRDRPDVTRRVLATGIDSMTVRPADGMGARGIEIALTWVGDRSDAADQATAFVAVRPDSWFTSE